MFNVEILEGQILLHGVWPRGLGMIKERMNKSGRKVFLARATGPDRKFYHKTFYLKREAKRWLVAQAAKKIEGDYVVTPNKITVKGYFKYYLECIRPRVEEATLADYENIIKNHIMPLFSKKKMVDITFDDGLLLQRTLADKGLSKKTNNKVLVLFKQVFKFSKSGKGEHRVIDKNPLDGFTLLRQEEKEIMFWDEDEIAEFAHEAKGDDYYDLYLFAINTGMRIGEICGLQSNKVNFKKNQIMVSSSLKPKIGGGYKIGVTKNKSIRYIPMNGTVRNIVRARVQGKRDDDLIFTNGEGEIIDMHHFCQRQFRPLQKRLGIKKCLRFHDLRHTFASNFIIQDGNDIISLQSMLGHRSINSTMIYTHSGNKQLQKAARRFEIKMAI